MRSIALWQYYNDRLGTETSRPRSVDMAEVEARVLAMLMSGTPIPMPDIARMGNERFAELVQKARFPAVTTTSDPIDKQCVYAQENQTQATKEIDMKLTIKKVTLLNGVEIGSHGTPYLIEVLTNASDQISSLRKVKATMPPHVTSESASAKAINAELDGLSEVYNEVVAELDRRG